MKPKEPIIKPVEPFFSGQNQPSQPTRKESVSPSPVQPYDEYGQQGRTKSNQPLPPPPPAAVLNKHIVDLKPVGLGIPSTASLPTKYEQPLVPKILQNRTEKFPSEA